MQTLKSWLNVTFFATLLGSFVRLLFFILLAPKELQTISPETPYYEILKAFTLGFRFDLSAVCYIGLVFWLISLIISKKHALFVWKILLTYWSFLLIIDIGFFSFYNDRINVLMFGLFADDTWALLKTFWKNYPVLPILFLTVLFFYFINFLVKKNFPLHAESLSKTMAESQSKMSRFKIRAIVFILLSLGSRGTLNLFPLGDHDTVVSSVPFLNTLSYGTAHAFSRAIQLKRKQLKMGTSSWSANLKEFGYLGFEDQAFVDYFQKPIPPTGSRFSLMQFTTTLNLKHSQKPHVVLVVMESWGQYGLQFNDSTFDLVGKMKFHFNNGLLNNQFLSSTQATTGSLSCLLAGLPHRTISPFLTESDYLQTQLSTSPALVYKNQGYQTRFVYGGNPGWRDMNKFALAQGYQEVLGEVDIEKAFANTKNPVKERHDWGLFDQDVFRYVNLLLQEAKVPQMIVVMTTTNHPPYELPQNVKYPDLDIDKFSEKNKLIDPKLAGKRFAAFRYSSDSLADFISQTKTETNLQKKIILAVTADHTFWVKNFSSSEVFMKSAVPFYIAVPDYLKQQLAKQQISYFQNSFGSHQDIWPTLYELSLSEAQFESFGRSLFNDPAESFALTYERIIFNNQRGEFIQSAKEFNSFSAEQKLSYKPDADKIDADYSLAKKYRALMAALDSYLYHSKIHP